MAPVAYSREYFINGSIDFYAYYTIREPRKLYYVQCFLIKIFPVVDISRSEL